MLDHRLPARITPAYAGKSSYPPSLRATASDHPRVRGEEVLSILGSILGLGSPPRTRGRAVLTWWPCPARRITPAYAGKRRELALATRPGADHPRVRGEETS